jgi:hypothetical protein
VSQIIGANPVLDEHPVRTIIKQEAFGSPLEPWVIRMFNKEIVNTPIVVIITLTSLFILLQLMF